MNILMVHNYYQIPGGEDTVVRNEKALLEQNGCRVFLYTRHNSEIDQFSVWRKLLLSFTSIFSLKTYREIKKIIQQEKIDIVHVHNTLSLISPAVYYAALHENVPVVQTVHNYRLICPGAMLYRNGKVCTDCIEGGLRCALAHQCYRNSQVQTFVSTMVLWLHRKLGVYRKIYYICLTDFNRRKLLESGKKKRILFDEQKMYVKPNFTDFADEYKPYSERKRQFVYVGRLDCLKGIRLLLKQWENIPEKLIVCGTGPEEEWCRRFCLEKHMEQVELRGQLKHEKIMELIGESEALIFPTQWYEGQPMTIIESFAAGTPVIGTAIGNVAEMIEDGKTGILVDLKLNGLAGALRQLNAEMCEFCRGEYERKYTQQANYMRFQEIWVDIKKSTNRMDERERDER